METPNDAIIDNSKFPLTTQEGLSPRDQALIDAIKLDELRLQERVDRAQRRYLQALKALASVRRLVVKLSIQG